MTNVALSATDGTPGARRHPFFRLIGTLFQVVTAPVRAFQAVRHAMTPASVSLLLLGIVTLNIIWGFPWTGMFSACVGMFLSGCLIHFATRPLLACHFTLPSSSPSGQSFSVTIHARNLRILPALDFTLSFAQPKTARRRWFRRRQTSLPAYWVRETAIRNTVLRSGETADLNTSLQFFRRGIHPLPKIIIRAGFPFHLFESTVVYPSAGTIAITPRVLAADDTAAKGLLDNLGGWSHRLLSGDELDYTGSREYEPGMAVRRWDFPSWARLGVPIVREFQSPSIQKVFLIIDTGLDEQIGSRSDTEESHFERMFSLAATAIQKLSRKSVQIELFVTGESQSNPDFSGSSSIATDSESLLIRLAAAESVPVASADEQLVRMLEIAGRSPSLILSTRSLLNLKTNANPHAQIIRICDTDLSIPTEALEPGN